MWLRECSLPFKTHFLLWLVCASQSENLLVPWGDKKSQCIWCTESFVEFFLSCSFNFSCIYGGGLGGLGGLWCMTSLFSNFVRICHLKFTLHFPPRQKHFWQVARTYMEHNCLGFAWLFETKNKINFFCPYLCFLIIMLEKKDRDLFSK